MHVLLSATEHLALHAQREVFLFDVRTTLQRLEDSLLHEGDPLQPVEERTLDARLAVDLYRVEHTEDVFLLLVLIFLLKGIHGLISRASFFRCLVGVDLRIEIVHNDFAIYESGTLGCEQAEDTGLITDLMKIATSVDKIGASVVRVHHRTNTI